jgi:hypothetical protein
LLARLKNLAGNLNRKRCGDGMGFFNFPAVAKGYYFLRLKQVVTPLGHALLDPIQQVLLLAVSIFPLLVAHLPITP